MITEQCKNDIVRYVGGFTTKAWVEDINSVGESYESGGLTLEELDSFAADIRRAMTSVTMPNK